MPENEEDIVGTEENVQDTTENTTEETNKTNPTTPVETKESALTEARELAKQNKEAENVIAELKKDMVEVNIPENQLNEKDLAVDVFINGYRFTIERGKDVQVPRRVKEILKEAKYI